MVRTTMLDNGAKIVTEVVDQVYSASIGIWVDVGSEDENELSNGVSHCLEHMLFKGTKKRSAQEIAQEIEMSAAHWVPRQARRTLVFMVGFWAINFL